MIGIGVGLSILDTGFYSRISGSVSEAIVSREDVAAIAPMFWDFTTIEADHIEYIGSHPNLGTGGSAYDLVSTGLTTNQPRWDAGKTALYWAGFKLPADVNIGGMYVYSTFQIVGNGTAILNMSSNGKNSVELGPNGNLFKMTKNGLANQFIDAAILKKDQMVMARTHVTPTFMEAMVNGQVMGLNASTQLAADQLYQLLYGRAGDGRVTPARYMAQCWIPDTTPIEDIEKVERYMASLGGVVMVADAAKERSVIIAGQSLALHMTDLFGGAGAMTLKAKYGEKYGYGVTPIKAASGSTPLIVYGAGAEPWWDRITDTAGYWYTNLVTPKVGTTSTITDIAWSQGQKDCEDVNTNKPDYKQALKSLCTKFNADFGGKVVIQVLGRSTTEYTNTLAAQYIREAQYEVSEELAFVSLGSAQYNLPLTDTVHLSEYGNDIAGAQAAWGLLKAYGKTTVTAPTIVSAQRSGDTIQVTLDKGNSATAWVVNSIETASIDLTPTAGKVAQIELIKPDNSRVSPTSVVLTNDTVVLTYDAGVLDAASGAKIYNMFSTGHLVEFTKMISSNSIYKLPIYTIMPVSVTGL